MNRLFERRLRRLEIAAARSRPDAKMSFLITFVNPQMRVTSTLLLENGQQIWTKLPRKDASDYGTNESISA
jgi:hypothetical protein